jgi:PAS domain S-box-containing protein
MDRALALAGAGVWRIDLATQLVQMNAVGRMLIGLPDRRDEIPLDDIRVLMHPDDVRAMDSASEAALAGDVVVDEKARYLQADGSWRTLLTRRVADRDADGRPVALTGVVLDVSAQEAERRRAEELAGLAQLVSDAIGIGYFRRDVASGEITWNAAMFRIHRCDPSQPPPRYDEWIERCVHPQDQAWLAARLRRADAGWEPSLELIFRAPDEAGQERWIQSWTRRDWRDGQPVSFGMQQDITQRRRAADLQQRERDRHEFAMQVAQVGVWERDAQGRVSHWSEVMYRQRGLDPADPRPPELIHQELTHPQDWLHLERIARRHLDHDEPHRAEFRVRMPDGSWRWFATQGQAMRDAQGRLLGSAGVNLDITERKHADTLQREKLRLEQASRDKSAFMARVSHELRTPMNAVLGFTRLLEDDTLEPPSARQRERLAHIGQAAERLLALIDDMLQVSALETQGEPPATAAQPVPLHEALQEARALVADDAGAKGVTLELAAGDAALAVQAPRMRLAQALAQVLRQGLRRCSRGAVLRVDMAPVPAGAGAEPRAEVRLTQRGGEPQPQGLLFASGDSPGTDRPEDMTLALELLQTLLRPLGAQVLASPAPAAAGSFPAPLQQGAEPPRPLCTLLFPAQSTGVSAAAFQGLHVLYVEDNPVNLQLVCEVLALRPRVRLRTAVDGHSGIAAALADPPDLVLLDLQLPDLHGIEVMRRLRAAPGLAGSMFVALSADAMAEHIQAALDEGFDAYWTKPIHFDRFLADIDRLSAERVR